MAEDDDFASRAEHRRRTWQGQLTREPRAVQASESTVEARVAYLRVVSETAWAFSGQEMPTYTRATMPGRILRPA